MPHRIFSSLLLLILTTHIGACVSSETIDGGSKGNHTLLNQQSDRNLNNLKDAVKKSAAIGRESAMKRIQARDILAESHWQTQPPISLFGETAAKMTSSTSQSIRFEPKSQKESVGCKLRPPICVIQSPDSSFQRPMAIVLVFTVIWSFILLIGIIGNLLVIVVLVRTPTGMVYEIFCVGLALTDLTYLTVSSTTTVTQYYKTDWLFGLLLCKMLNFIIQVGLYL